MNEFVKNVEAPNPMAEIQGILDPNEALRQLKTKMQLQQDYH